MKKILKYFIIFLAFIGVIISISRPTSAKYFALEFGDIWDVKFSKFSTYAAEFVVGDETKKQILITFIGRAVIFGGLENLKIKIKT